MNVDVEKNEVTDAELANFDGEAAEIQAADAEADDTAAAQVPVANETEEIERGDDPDPEFDPKVLAAIAGGADADGPMIPKSRFDEATGKLKDRLDTVQSELETIKSQQQAALSELPERDFDAERAELKDRLNSGEIDEDEYADARDALVLEQAEYKVQARLLLAQAERQRVATEQAWLGQFNDWAGRNADFMSNSIRSKQAVELINSLSQDPSLTDAQIFEKAEKELFEAFNWSGHEHESPAAGGSPHTSRNARDAQAIAAASAAPNPAAAGSGDRGRASFPGLTEAKDADWKRLPKELRESKELADF